MIQHGPNAAPQQTSMSIEFLGSFGKTSRRETNGYYSKYLTKETTRMFFGRRMMMVID